MTAHRLFYLNTHRLTAYVWRQGRLHAEGSFTHSDDGLLAFSHYLARWRNSHFALLANVAEEDHVLETIPFLSRGDRQALIARKISQHFMGSPLATAFSLGYEKTRRKNEKLLLSALTNPAHFEPWLKRIADAEAPLSGIYTVAQLGGQLLKKLDGERQGCLLLTMQDHSIRESYLRDDQTLFSRMAPISDSSIAGIASSFAAEAGKLQQYLIGQRLISRDDHLPALIVAYPPAVPAITKACQGHDNLGFTIVDSHLAARKLGLKTLPEDNRCDLLYLQLLASDPPRQQFAGAGHRHDYQVDRLRRGILAAGLITLLGGLLLTAHNAWTAYELRRETLALQASESELEERYGKIAATFPQLGIDNDTLRRLTDQYAALSQQRRHPEQALRRLGQTLERMPAIILDRIEWRIGRDVPGSASGKAPDNTSAIDGRDETTIVHGHVQLAPTASAREVLTL
ncbi:MAG: hypothetical protein FWD50_02960, partial [Betaproteobacteria bacterium]|nr:hypothetical protein [Betaproteobacteria bacterium]